MKYIAFYQFNWKDLEKITEVSKKVFDEREKGSGRFLKPDQLLFSHHTFNADLPKKSKERMGFFLCETDDEDVLINFSMMYAGLWEMKFIPLTDGRKTLRSWMSHITDRTI